jgi:ribonuclease H / adenosylcobalamin/alpha-ribazole phosphatase
MGQQALGIQSPHAVALSDKRLWLQNPDGTKSMTTELLLIRHGESEANAGRASTADDCALTNAGLEQSRQLAQRLAAHDLQGFTGLVSPYRRARQTAAPIAQATGLSFAVEDAIREWGPAITIDGRHYPEETIEEAAARLKEFLRRHRDRKLVLVSHATPIWLLTQLAWGEPCHTDAPFWSNVGNCCLRSVRSTCG